MLKRWLSAEALREFKACQRARRAFAAPSIVRRIPCLFDWTVLDEVLQSEPKPDVLVVRRNELLSMPPIESAAQTRRMFADELGLVVRRAQTHSSSLRALSADFEREFSCSAHLQLFVTPGGSYGFGWHYDLDDVVILQTVGQKEFSFRANTQGVPDDPTAKLDFAAVRLETSPLCRCTLEAGDALYLPRGMWHVARAREDALSISIGLQTKRERR